MPSRQLPKRKPVSLRLRAGLMDKVRAYAEAEEKSLNEAMNHLIATGLQEGRLPPALREILLSRDRIIVELGEIKQALLKLALR